jgi:hypothetical protein
MDDANQKNINEKQRQFWTRPRPKNDFNPDKTHKPERQFWTVPRSKNNTNEKEKPKPAKAPLCHHHNGDCEADIPEHVLQNAGVPQGLYCETLEEQRLREEEEVCLYADYYHPE